MFCYVKYLCDGERAIVPSTFVKYFEENTKNLKNKNFEVFWSPRPEDTPSSLLERQGKILTIDEEMESTHKKKSKTPLPGYYFARILMISDSEKELESFLDSKGGRKKKSLMEKDVSQKKQKDKKNDVVQQGKKKSTEMLFNSCNNIRSVFSDSDSDNCIDSKENEQITELKNTNKRLVEKNHNLKVKYKNLKVKFEEINNLNIKLQKKLLKSFKASATLSLPETNTFISDLPIVPSISSSKILPGLNEIQRMIDPNASIPNNCITTAPQSFPAVKECVEEKPYHLEESHFNRVTFRVKPGPPGDSMFVKNLALAVFGEEVLMKSSVTGAKCNSKKESIARPALCTERLNYIKKLFQERIERENPECQLEEKNKRLNKLNAFIGEKIITLGRTKK